MKRIIKTAVSFMLAATLMCGAVGLCYASVNVESVTVSTASTSNAAPVAENLLIFTYRGVPVKGELRAVDPDGDMLTFSISAEPKKGSVKLCENFFIYTPKEGKKGKDCFTYTATDARGNISNEATVNIVIEKQDTKVTYSDMGEDDNACAAIMLAEYGIYTGERIGGGYYFGADEKVTRGEFLAMCMELAGAEPLENMTRTGFADDGDMPQWVKPYVSAALMNGLISGYSNATGSLIFSPDAEISSFEAAVMLNNVLGVTDVVSVSAMDKAGYAPVWAVQAVANLNACNVASGFSSDSLTRGEAAEMLCAAIRLIESRGKDSSLLSWAKK